LNRAFIREKELNLSCCRSWRVTSMGSIFYSSFAK